MQQIETNQKTFGKATRKQIAKHCPDAMQSIKIGKDRKIVDSLGKTVATWHAPSHGSKRQNGLIVIH